MTGEAVGGIAAAAGPFGSRPRPEASVSDAIEPRGLRYTNESKENTPTITYRESASMIRKYPCISSLLLGLGLGLGASASAQGCDGAVPPPTCISVDDSGDVYPDYNVTSSCPNPVSLYFDVKEEGDDWVLDPYNFTAVYGYMAVQPDGSERSGIKYDTDLEIHCCPNTRGTSCSELPENLKES